MSAVSVATDPCQIAAMQGTPSLEALRMAIAASVVTGVSRDAPVAVAAAVAPGSGTNLTATPNKVWRLTPGQSAYIGLNPSRARLDVSNDVGTYGGGNACLKYIGPGDTHTAVTAADTHIVIPAGSLYEEPMPIWSGQLVVTNTTSTIVIVTELSYA